MSQHTPGPWQVDATEQRARGDERIFKVISGKPYGGLIADVSAWWVDTQSAEANARLIAKAPEMAAVLRRLVGEHGHLSVACNECREARALLKEIEG